MKGAKRLDMIVNGSTGGIAFAVELHVGSSAHKDAQVSSTLGNTQPTLHQFLPRLEKQSNLISSFDCEEDASRCYGFSSSDFRYKEMWTNIQPGSYKSLNFFPINFEELGPVKLFLKGLPNRFQ